MNKPKLLDKLQIAFIILGGSSIVLRTLFTALSIFLSEEDPETLELMPNMNLSLISTLFGSLTFLSVVWIVIRFITFKSRLKEYELENSCRIDNIMQ